jgi:acylphosphatase
MVADRTAHSGRIRLRIHGRVQGVGYRFSAVDEARRLGLRGWVRNTPDGAVELVAEGSEANLRRLATWCRSGPPGARVTGVDESREMAVGEFTEFGIRY